jgi:hypothetical protein
MTYLRKGNRSEMPTQVQILQMIENSETRNITLFILLLALSCVAAMITVGVFVAISRPQKKNNPVKELNQDKGQPKDSN